MNTDTNIKTNTKSNIKNSNNINLLKRFAACLYELLILLAIWMITAFIFIWLFGDATANAKRYGLQFVLWLAAGAYFLWCWCKSGQTLATLAWKMRLVNSNQTNLTAKQAAMRYALATVSFLALGLGFLWAIIDKEHCYLHDRLLKSRFVTVDKK
jgi:uncharacterized RDD family membrane protein YckC